MDQVTLVDGGAEGLNRIAEAFRSRGIPVAGVYLIKLTSEDGFEEWIIRLVADREKPDIKRKMIYELVRLRRDSQLPTVDPGVRFDIVSQTEPEASRIIEYAQRLGGPPVIIRDAVWKGLFVEYALVASVPHANVAIV